MENGASKEAIGAALDKSDSIESVHAGDIVNMEAVPEQDSDNRNTLQAINECLNKITKPTAGRRRVENKDLLPVVASGEFDYSPPDQVSTDQPRPAALGPLVMLNKRAEFDADEAEALLMDVNAVQAELNEAEEALALLLALGSAVGLARQLDSTY